MPRVILSTKIGYLGYDDSVYIMRVGIVHACICKRVDAVLGVDLKAVSSHRY